MSVVESTIADSNSIIVESTPIVPQTNFAVSEFSHLISNILHLDQTTSEIITSIIIFLSAIFIAWAGHAIFERYFSKWAQRTSTDLDDKILKNIKAPFFLIAILIGAYYSLVALSFLDSYADLFRGIFVVAEIFAIAFMIVRVAAVVVDWYAQRRAKQHVAVSNHLLFVFNKLIQVIVLVGALLAILWAFKVDLSGVIVGLGVGGIAIALAVQSTLSDVLSAFSIYFDRPFEIGDFVTVGEYAGTVTKIGIKSTRLQLLQGEELVVSNKELTATSLRNFKKLQKRRVVFSIGVIYDTPLEKLQKIPRLIEDVIRGVDSVEFNRAHFQSFGDFSLKFEVVYYVTTSDYNKYMDSQQAINFKIMAAFEKEGIQMAFPTQTIYMKREKASEGLEMAVPTQTILVKKEEQSRRNIEQA